MNFLLAQEFQGIDGFLGTRGSVMLDFVFLAMFAIVPIMLGSIYLVRFRKQYELHKRIQTILSVVLLVAVTAFEIDLRFFSNWVERAEPSRFFNSEHQWSCAAGIALIIHLCFAVPTPLLWIFVIVQGHRKFPKPAAPCDYSSTHKLTARMAALGMTGVWITGSIFYWMAFVAT